ncbi:N-acetyl-gamma-glutamyl-phosphate reductase [Coriobacterium glomerans PW2]|uniref:N-acetyl-gamma-glutamyl-phosphate reductase n=1 Tax=Coriobacterium glomerans (strain ATCC 49209 / DSM 20642 / JCM 10262 / PW2) TaxID=700015 RepID=F2NAQ7_CORGP|nr:N-acetyl-gamma-glutamyl-phosphate reductase [Coriobacterium glomerans]AEB07513.1 N-acetyl-gamma-glutamyl-phosphate reductase [Coriobacterium glomerans PW2]
MSIDVGIVGAAGYVGAELVRLLLDHPDFEVVAITSDADAGQTFASAYPSFSGVSDLVFTGHDDARLTECDAVFLAVPHTAAMALVPDLLSAGVTVIDLSADYRLAGADVFEQWYGVHHTSPQLLSTRFFGLPELFGDGLVAAAEQRAQGEPVLVSCAGCYPTATSLAAYPALDAGWIDSTSLIVVDAISGATGAGRTASARTHFCNVDENLEAYGVCRHRHTPEIEQILGAPGRVVFTPHLAPLKRGLLSTVTMVLSSEWASALTCEEAISRYRDFFNGRVFVRVMDEDEMPRTASVAGSNVCQIGLAISERTHSLIAVAAIDNLCKGAAGQAVQCANTLFGFDESRGLPLAALPV